ncbi:MAG: gamma-glutamyl-gamma-aminobutyrate hydrolase family protein [Bacteroidota bacterium]
MTRLVAISQRVVIDPRHGERRDALDQRWVPFLAACSLTPVALPNASAAALAILDQAPLGGLILSGGGDIGPLGGDTPERDEAEQLAVEWARAHHKPIIGICRGAQHLTHLFGGTLAPLAGHVGTRHALAPDGRMVNSFHGWGIAAAPPDAEILARSADDGSIEAFHLSRARLTALLWHPERELTPNLADITMFTQALDIDP